MIPGASPATPPHGSGEPLIDVRGLSKAFTLRLDVWVADIAVFDDENGLDLPLATQYAHWVGGMP